MRGLRIFDLWLACDSHARIKPFLKACEKLTKSGFNRNKIRCYVLIGDDMSENEERCRTVFQAGALPFAQLEQGREWIDYPKEWRNFQRLWARPALTKAHMKEVAA